MRLEIGGLIRNERVRSRVRLVKAIRREGLHLVEDLTRELVRHFLFGRACEEADTLFLHHLFAFLPHGAAQIVGFCQRVPGQDLGNLHHLLLIDRHTVGLFQRRLEERMQVGNRLLAVLASNELLGGAAI